MFLTLRRVERRNAILLMDLTTSKGFVVVDKFITGRRNYKLVIGNVRDLGSCLPQRFATKLQMTDFVAVVNCLCHEFIIL